MFAPELVAKVLPFLDLIGSWPVCLSTPENPEWGVIELVRITEIIEIVLDEVEPREIDVARRDANLLTLGDDFFEYVL